MKNLYQINISSLANTIWLISSFGILYFILSLTYNILQFLDFFENLTEIPIESIVNYALDWLVGMIGIVTGFVGIWSAAKKTGQMAGCFKHWLLVLATLYMLNLIVFCVLDFDWFYEQYDRIIGLGIYLFLFILVLGLIVLCFLCVYPYVKV